MQEETADGMKSAIYEFNPVIYPTRLWVCRRPNVEDVSELFYPIDSEGEIVDTWGEVFSGTGIYANTVIAGNKESRMRGCLVSLLLPGECGAGVCSHEALHYIAYLSEQFGIPLGGFDSSEPLAYLEQWATNCIWSVLVNKPEKMNGVKL